MVEKSIELAVSHLSQNDEVLRRIINEHGKCSINLRKNYFESLVHSIISQQLSNKAARAISLRLEQLVDGDLSPMSIQSIDSTELRKIGISNQKASFIKNLSAHFIDDKDSFQRLENMKNDEVISELVSIKGIGLWTAQMFLIFSLGRFNIIPHSDVGFQRSIMINYNLKAKPTEKQINKIAKNWGEFPSIAAWYLWKAIDG